MSEKFRSGCLHPDEVECLASGSTVAGVVGERFPRLVAGVLSKIPSEVARICLTKALTEDEERQLRAMLAVVPQEERITDAFLQLIDDASAAIKKFVDVVGMDLAAAIMVAGVGVKTTSRAEA